MAVRWRTIGMVAGSSLTLVAIVFLSGSAASAADILTCDLFRTQLDEALKALDAKTATPLVYGPGKDMGRAGRSYPWSIGEGVSGRLTCAPSGAFADFYIARETASAPLRHLDGFKELGAASICALSSGMPAACRTLIDTITGDGIDQYEERTEKATGPVQGLQNYDITTSAEAVFNITPRLVSWAIGPGVFSTTEATRPTLEPHDHDEDEDD